MILMQAFCNAHSDFHIEKTDLILIRTKGYWNGATRLCSCDYQNEILDKSDCKLTDTSMLC